MPLNNTTQQYGEMTKFFHWVTAALIFMIIPLGVIANGAPFETSEELANKARLFSLHKTLGVAVFFVALARIAWALTQTKPAPLHPDAKAETFAADVVHWLLYGSLILAPLSGWIHHAATTGFAPIWWPFGQNLPLVPKSDVVSHTFASMHWIWTKVMVASLLLHIAGALKHQIIDKDVTLRRMWFGAIEPLNLIKIHKSVVAPLVAAGIFALTGLAATLSGAEAEQTQTTALAAASSDWTVTDGEIALTITQFGSPVTGRFDDWTSSISFDPETGLGNVETKINIGSLILGSVTDQAKGVDFFDANTFPTAVFQGEITPNSNGGYIATGTLAIKEQIVPVELPFSLEIAGPVAQMTGELTVDRLDFAIGANMPDETNLAFAVTIAIQLSAEFNP